MNRSIFMDPNRANDPDVIAAYEADREILRKHANFEELEALARQYSDITNGKGRGRRHGSLHGARFANLRNAKLIPGVSAQCVLGHELLDDLASKTRLDGIVTLAH